VGDTITSNNTAVEQFPTNFTSTTTPATAIVSTSSPSTSTILYAGSFDNLHYDIGGSGGNMYVCGVHHTGLDPALFQVAMNTTFGSSVTEAEAIVADTSGFVPCSPVTEFLGSKANTTLSAAISSVPSDTTLAAAINHTTNPTATSLNGTITAAATSVAVSSATNIAAGDYISVGTEYMYYLLNSHHRTDWDKRHDGGIRPDWHGNPEHNCDERNDRGGIDANGHARGRWHDSSNPHQRHNSFSLDPGQCCICNRHCRE